MNLGHSCVAVSVSAASLALPLTEISQIDMPDLRYVIMNFGARNEPGLTNWGDQIERDRDRAWRSQGRGRFRMSEVPLFSGRSRTSRAVPAPNLQNLQGYLAHKKHPPP